MGTETAELTPGLYRTIVAVVDERMGEMKVNREDFSTLRAAMERLAEAQARTEERMTGLEAAMERLEATVERLAEAQARTEERMTGLEAAMERLAEAQTRTEERVTGLEAAVERLAEAQTRTEERVTGLEAAVERLAEAQARTEERMTRLEAAVERLAEAQAKFGRTFETRLGALGARWGLDTEESFRQGMRAILEDVGFKVERYLVYDHAGQVFDRPDQVELDVVVRDGKLMIIEIKSSASRADVAAFNRKVNFYEEREGRKAERRLLICPFVGEGARRMALTMDIEVYTRADDLTGT